MVHVVHRADHVAVGKVALGVLEGHGRCDRLRVARSHATVAGVSSLVLARDPVNPASTCLRRFGVRNDRFPVKAEMKEALRVCRTALVKEPSTHRGKGSRVVRTATAERIAKRSRHTASWTDTLRSKASLGLRRQESPSPSAASFGDPCSRCPPHGVVHAADGLRRLGDRQPRLLRAPLEVAGTGFARRRRRRHEDRGSGRQPDAGFSGRRPLKRHATKRRTGPRKAVTRSE